MNPKNIAQALRIIFNDNSVVNEHDYLYNLNIAELFYNKFGIVIGYDHLPNSGLFYPYIRTINYKPMRSHKREGFRGHMITMSNVLHIHKGTIKECYLKSIYLAVTYIIVKLYPTITLSAEKFDDWTFVNIVIQLDRYDYECYNKDLLKDIDINKLLKVLNIR